MATAAEPLLMTVEEFYGLPDREDVRQELHWGQVVTLSQPKTGHTRIQIRLLAILEPMAKAVGVVVMELPVRALPQYDLRRVDLAFVTRSRWKSIDDDDHLHGSPELVVEVLSPSNTKAEIREKAALFLSTGAHEFLVIDPKLRTVSVARREGDSRVYKEGDIIPLELLGGELAVADIFEQPHA